MYDLGNFEDKVYQLEQPLQNDIDMKHKARKTENVKSDRVTNF